MKIAGSLIVFIVIIFSFQYGHAQDALFGIEKLIKHEPVDNNKDKPILYDFVQGSPYLNETFIDGELKLNTGKTFKVPVRYDIFADQLEYKNPDNVIFLVQNPAAIQLVIVDSLMFNYFQPGEFRDIQGFIQILVIGNYSLYKKYQILLKNPDAAGPGLHANAAMFLPQDSKYYIMDPDANFIEIESKKDLIVTGRDKDELEKFIKDNKIKIRNEEHLIRYVEFLNQ